MVPSKLDEDNEFEMEERVEEEEEEVEREDEGIGIEEEAVGIEAATTVAVLAVVGVNVNLSKISVF